jgi:hypothetical protein
MTAADTLARIEVMIDTMLGSTGYQFEDAADLARARHTCIGNALVEAAVHLLGEHRYGEANDLLQLGYARTQELVREMMMSPEQREIVADLATKMRATLERRVSTGELAATNRLTPDELRELGLEPGGVLPDDVELPMPDEPPGGPLELDDPHGDEEPRA